MTLMQLEVAREGCTIDYHETGDPAYAIRAQEIEDEIEMRNCMKIKLFYLHPANPDLDLWADCETRGYIIRAPSEDIAREQPKRDDSWFTNGGKSPWKDASLVKCFEIAEINTPIYSASGQALSPEEATGILYAVPK